MAAKENSKGQSYPIGIWIPDWAAGYAANALVAILLEETETSTFCEYGDVLF